MSDSKSSHWLRGAIFSLVFSFVGCSPDGPVGKAVPVGGTVEMDGTPLVNVRIEFVPESPAQKVPASSGTTDKDGHFALKTGDGRDGAIVGKHKVILHSERSDERSNSPGSPRKVPTIYSTDGALNPLGTVEVTESKKTGYDFSLKSK